MTSRQELRKLIANAIRQEQSCTPTTAMSRAEHMLSDYDDSMGNGMQRLVANALHLGCAITITITPSSGTNTNTDDDALADDAEDEANAGEGR